jgi:DNA primase
MRFSQDFLDELRARLPVSEVVGRRVKLKKAGREWKGLSPFNKENTASLFCNDQKMAWFDFSSGKNGTIFDFVMLTEGVTFPEAVERLAVMAGLPLPQRSPDEDERAERRKTIYEVLELAAKFFEATLTARTGAQARGYCADRQLDPKTQLAFRIGYAPAERFALKEHLGSQGISTPDMIAAGLLVHGDDIPVPYDRFRQRVMFPITDLRGRVVGFGGRALHPDAKAKYLNSPETELFHKGALLYNGAAARKAILEAKSGARDPTLVVVEGYTDVVSMVREGFPATVAPLGTALTEDQLALLWKLSDEPVLCFDGDPAGRRAAYRAIDLALPHISAGKSLRFASMPSGHDPDDVARRGGHQALALVIGAAVPMADMLWRRETEAGGFDTPERRAALEARFEAAASTIGDRRVAYQYRQEMRQRCWHTFRGVKRKAFAGGQPSDELANTRLVVDGLAAAGELAVVAALLRWPALIEQHAEAVANIPFRDPDANALVEVLLGWVASGFKGPVRDALAGMHEAALARCDAAARLLPGEDDVPAWWERSVALLLAQQEARDAAADLEREPTEEAVRRLRDAHVALERAGKVPAQEAL